MEYFTDGAEGTIKTVHFLKELIQKIKILFSKWVGGGGALAGIYTESRQENTVSAYLNWYYTYP
jgi:hypothetical protein